MSAAAAEGLAPDELAALHDLLRREKPAFAGRVATSTVELVAQPFFARHRIGVWRSETPAPARFFHFAIASAADVVTIQKRLDRLAAVADKDPPAGLDDAERARDYALRCDEWTSEYMLGQLPVASFAEIPFWARMQAPTEGRVEALRAQAAARMGPVTVAPAKPAGWMVEAWFVADQKLIRRRILVRPGGRVARDDEIVASDLPVHRGNTWAMREGRMVPAS